MDIIPVLAVPGINSLTQHQNFEQVTVGYRASLTEIADFEQSLNGVKQRNVARAAEPSNTEKVVIKPLDFINTEAENIINYAKTAVKSGNELTPSEIIMLTAKSHEFMFHCQLTSNIANRTSDGLQQLFRQQS